MRERGDRLRHAVRQCHLWLGLGLGGLFVLLGLTGSVLAFYPEIDGALHPEIRVGTRTAPDWDRAHATVLETWPEKTGPWRFEVTGQPGPIPARYYDPPERAGHQFRPMMVWLSNDGTRVLRRDYWGEYAMTFVYDLHYRLLLGKTGGVVLGWTGFVLIALVVSGLWAWWPRGSGPVAWAKALRLRPRAHPHRALRDWHKLSGLSGLVLLLVLIATGIMLELPKERDAALAAAGLGVAEGPNVHPVGAGPVIPVTRAIAAAHAALPGARLAWIETPPASGGLYRLRMQVPGDPSRRFPQSFVWVDAATGTVRAVTDARAAPAGSVVNSWVHPLHDGSAGGFAGRVVVALSGLLPLALFITGVARWWGRRARRAQSRPRASRPA